MVPAASAQQAAALTKWDYLCFTETEFDGVQPKAQAAGLQGWEMVAVVHPGVWCFKRPKL